MKRFGKLAVFAGLVLLGMGVLQARHGHDADHHDSGALHAVAHVSSGVMDRIIDLSRFRTSMSRIFFETPIRARLGMSTMNLPGIDT